MKQIRSKQAYKVLYFMIMLYFLVLLCSIIFLDKTIKYPVIGKASMAVIFISIQYVLSDIITEVYGYYTCKNIIFSAVIMLIIFSFLATHISEKIYPDIPFSIVTLVPQAYYKAIFNDSLPSSLSFAISYLVSTLVNSFILQKLKIKYMSKLFWLRSLQASSVGAFIFVIMDHVGFIFLFGLPLLSAVQHTIFSFVLKLIIFAILAYPANLLVYLLINIEGDNNQESNNKFSLSV